MQVLGNPDQQWKSPYTQQGDVLIKKCGVFGVFKQEYHEIPSDAEPVQGGLVLKGASNSHGLFKGKFQVLKKGDVTFLRVDEPCILDHVEDMSGQKHAEHHAQWIPVGEYFVDQVQEFDHIKNEQRAIID